MREAGDALGCGCYTGTDWYGAARHASVKQTPPKKNIYSLLQYDIHRGFWRCCPSTDTHVRKRWTLRVFFCANRLRSTFSQNCSSQCAKTSANREGGETHACSLHLTRRAKEKWCITLSRRLVISQHHPKPEPDTAAMSPLITVVPPSSPSAPPLCASFDGAHFDTASLPSPHLTHPGG